MSFRDTPQMPVRKNFVPFAISSDCSTMSIAMNGTLSVSHLPVNSAGGADSLTLGQPTSPASITEALERMFAMSDMRSTR